MKRFLLTTLSILLFANTASAFELLKRGSHTCQYEFNGKNVTCIMHTDGKGTVFFDGDCDAVEDEATFVKQHNCQYNRNSTKTYVCEYTDRTCNAIIFGNGASSTSCQKKGNFQYQNSFENVDRVLEDAKNGKCRPEL